MGGLLATLFPILGQVIDKSVPDVAARDAAKQELKIVLVERLGDIVEAAASIIRAEANGSWLQRNWRPMTALVFVGLVVSRWLGFTVPNMTEAEYLEVYQIIKVMIGGYVVSRGIEKGIDRWKN